MDKAIIYFSDKSTIELKENDYINPIVSHESNNEITASMDEPIELLNHVHNGLIPSLMDAFLKCDFFYLNHDYNTAYNSKSIVKIELA